MSTLEEFWHRAGDMWPVCETGKCELPAVMGELHGGDLLYRCWEHGGVGNEIYRTKETPWITIGEQ